MSLYQWNTQPIPFDLRRTLRANRVTLRQFAADCGITLKQARHIATLPTVPLVDYESFWHRISQRRLAL